MTPHDMETLKGELLALVDKLQSDLDRGIESHGLVVLVASPEQIGLIMDSLLLWCSRLAEQQVDDDDEDDDDEWSYGASSTNGVVVNYVPMLLATTPLPARSQQSELVDNIVELISARPYIVDSQPKPRHIARE